MMAFGPRNAYYLRISSHIVLPLYLYLDNRHIAWMTYRTLQMVIADLQYLILPKLRAESNTRLDPGGPANAKRGTIDVHRGETYQFAFFFRKAEQHSVLIKTRSFSAAPSTTHTSISLHKAVDHSTTMPDKRKRVRVTTSVIDEIESRRRKKIKVPQISDLSDADEEVYDGEIDEEYGNSMTDSAVKVENNEPFLTEEAPSSTLDLQLPAMPEADDEGEEKAKPKLKLGFENFTIFGRCLCVIVEPWPIRDMQSNSAVSRGISDVVSSSCLSTGVSTSDQELASFPDHTPLFLPGSDHDEDSDFNPFLSPRLTSDEQVVPIRGHEGDELMIFSQVLNSLTGNRFGSVDSEDDMDGLILLGDADESRSLYQ